MLLLASLIVHAPPALAALQIVVASTSDAVDARPGDGICRTSAGKCTLRAAIQEANARAGADTIQLPAGTFALAIAPRNDNLAASGDLDVTGPLTIVGAGPGLTIIDGGAPPAGAPPERRGLDRLFELHPTAGNITMVGLTLREGYSAESGGAIQFASSGTLRLTNVHVLDSYAAKYGGGINNAAGGRAELTGATLSGNGALEGGSAINNAAGGSVAILAGSAVTNNPGAYPLGGGAVHNQALSGAAGTIRIADSTVSANGARHPGAGVHNAGEGQIVVERSTIAGNSTAGAGGGIYSAGGAVSVAESRLADNVAHTGGGIYHAGLLSAAGQRGRVVVTGSTIAGNRAASGGGIYNDLEGELLLTDVEVTSNRADAEGGGVSSQSKTSLTVTRGRFSGNSAGDEGGGLAVASERAATLSGAVFANNAAGGGGGGLYSDGSGPVDIAGATFERNRAGGDGGAIAIHSLGATTIADTVVRNNASEGNGGGVENSGMAVSFASVTIAGNVAGLDGGGVHNSSSGAFRISDSAVEGNSAGNGGGLANHPDGTLVVLRSRFSANTARLEGLYSGLGGGVYSAGDGAASIEESSITGNTAGVAGGGIYHDADAELQIVNATISGNTAAAAGGGIAHDADGGLRVVNATIWRNAAPEGGAIGTPGPEDAPATPDAMVTLRNTIVGGSGQGGSCDKAVTSEGGNLDSGSACFPQGPRDRSNVDAIVDALADNGGPTPTHAIRADSPAVDGGVRPCPPTDQRGVARAQIGPCDSGAVEHVGEQGPTDSTPPVATIESMPGATTTSTSASFGFSANEAGATFTCSLDGSAFAACVSPVTYTGLAAGPHTFQVRAQDVAGNIGTSPATYTWTIEGPAPDCAIQVSAAADADAWLEQNGPASNKGDDSILKVKAQGPSDNFRALLRFTLPDSAPAGCLVASARLRLYAAASTPGRTIQALRVTGAWSEGGVTWGSQPPTAEAAATTSAESGYWEWDVAAQVQAMYDAGANHGFLIRDALEGGSGGEQQFHSREKGEHPPLLVVSFGATAPPPAEAVEEYEPDEVLIKLQSPSDLAGIAQQFGLSPTPLDQFGARPIYLMAITDGAAPLEKAAALAADPRVDVAEPNYVGQTPEGIGRSSWAGGRSSWAGGGSADDYAGQWAPRAMRLPEAHAVSRGAGVTIAVLDTGVDAAHSALAGRLSRGFDFVDMDADPREEGSVADLAYGHGTHVAGLLALAAPDATIMPVRALEADGSGNLWVTLEALQYAVNPDGDLRTTADSADIINMSFSYLRPSRLLEQLVREVTCDDDDNDNHEAAEDLCDATGGRGAVFVAAAGNQGSTTPEYPAAEPVSGLLAVAASTAADGLASFSNRGPWVHIAAPGEQIMSSVPGDAYGSWSGTSMAAPLVAGAVALMLARDPELSAAEAVSQVLDAAAPLSGDVPLRIDAAAALGLPR